MPRMPRKISKTGIYHIMIRGNEKKNIFLDNGDRSRFIKILSTIKTEETYELYSYCIMPNHVHLIIRDHDDEISNIMKRINTAYAKYFNYKYDRVGHVFQDRFKSEVIENDRYLLSAIRYVHNNPVKARMTKNPSNYKWSSYKDYIGKDDDKNITDIEFPLSLYNKDKKIAIELFKKFTMKNNDDKFIDIREKKNYSLKNYKECMNYIGIYCKENGAEFDDLIGLEMNREKKIKLISFLKKESNLSVAKLSEIFKLSKSSIYRI